MPSYRYPEPSVSTMKVLGSVINPQLNELDVDRENFSKLFPDASMRSPVEWKLEDDLRDKLLKTAADFETAPNEYATQLQFAKILQSAGYPLKNALRLSESGAVQQELGLQYKENGTFEAMSNTFLSGWYGTRVGKNFGKYMATGDERYLRLAEDYESKALQYKTAKTGYGWLGDLAVAGASTAGTSSTATVGGIAITGAATLIGMLVGGPAGATIGYTAGQYAGKAWTMYEAGLEQAGSDFYELYKMTDSNGRRIDLSTEEMKALFLVDSLLQGTIEVVGLEWAPGYKQMLNLIAPSVMRESITRTFGELLRKYGADVIKGIIGESLEEFAQEWAGSAIENAVLMASNSEDGTDFEYNNWRDIMSSASKAFGEAAKGMILQSVVSNALGIGLDSVKTSIASKNQTFSFDPNKRQGVIDSRYIAGSDRLRAQAQAEETQSKETGETSGKPQEKVPQIKVVQTERGAVPATQEDAANLKELYRRNKGKDSFSVIIEGVSEDTLKTEDRASVLNTMGAYLNGYEDSGDVLGYGGGSIVVSDEEAAERVRDTLSKEGLQRTAEGGDIVLVRDGASTRIGVITQAQAEAEGLKYRPISTWQYANMRVKSATRASAQEFLDQVEQQDALKTLIQRMTGMSAEEVNDAFENDVDSISMNLPDGVTWENLSASAMFMPIMSQITGRTTEDLLSDNLIQFDVTGKTQYVDLETQRNMTYNAQTGKVELRDAGTGDVIREYDPSDREHVAVAKADMSVKGDNGNRQYTIHVHRDAGAEDIMHELMHVTRSLASKERLSGFMKAYGAEDLWTDDIKDNGDGTWSFNGQTYGTRAEAYNLARANEERFVRDFMQYLYDGTAPNAEVRSFFQSLKDFLRRFIDQFRDSLSQDTVRAFEKLLNGEVDPALGETMEQAVEASELTLTDNVPQWEANDYSDADMYDEQGNPLYSLAPDDYEPKKIGHGYKLFEQSLKTGNIYPLFIGSRQSTPIDKWLIADNIPTKGFAKRPGWHIGSGAPFAPWLIGRNGQYNSKRGKGFRRVWAEVSYTMDRNYQDELDERGITDIKDHIPENGYYEFREANGGVWYISGALKVDKILEPEEVKAILDKKGVDYNSTVREQVKSKFKTELPEDYSLYSLASDKQWQTMDANTQRRIDADYEYTRNQYINTDKWMKAPNGQPTNLTERQWVQVRTPAFKAWFGDWENDPENASKMIDTNGEPIVFYHGSDSDFDTFERSYIGTAHDSGFFGAGFYFAFHNFDNYHHNRDEASYYGPVVKSFFLNIRNPFDVREAIYGRGGSLFKSDVKAMLNVMKNFPEVDWGSPSFWKDGEFQNYTREEMISLIESKWDFAEKHSRITELESEQGKEYVLHIEKENPSYEWDVFSGSYETTREEVEKAKELTIDRYVREELGLYDVPYSIRSYMEGTNFTDVIKQRGFDGIVQSMAGDEAVVFNSNQIKSATDNSGAFSPDTDNTLFSLAPAVGTEEFEQWFKGSKVVDAEGNPLVVYHGSPVRGIDEFNADNRINGGEGLIYATDSEAVAEGFSQEFTQGSSFLRNRPTGRTGQVYQVYMDIKNPLDFRNLSEAEKDIIAQSNDRISARTDSREDLDKAYEVGNDQYVKFLARDIISNLPQYGYDGIIARMGEGDALEFGAVNADQVKRVATGDTLYKYDTDEEAERLYSIRPDTYSEVADYISTMPEAERDRIFRNLEQFKGSPWYYQTLSAALVRRDMESLINGEGIPSDSFLYKASRSKDGTYAVIEALKKGPEGVFGYVQSHSLVANSEKALFAINGSTLDCNPTPECAQFCYVTNGQMAYPTSIIKAEMVALAIRLDPVRAARMAAIQYKYQAGYDTKLVMRMFDRGDFSAEYVPFIKELNKQGVGVQIFTKRPDFLYEIDRQRNVVMMSVDHSNVDMIEKYPDLPIAVVYQGKEDVPMIESLEKRFKEHKGVILPVKIGREYVSEEDIMALPQWARVKFTCNIDRGLKTIDNWNCRKCDLNGINGCFFERGVKDREMVGRSIEDMSIGEIYDIIGSLKDRNDATKELIGRGINLWDPRFGRVLDELLALRNRELEGSLRGATAQTGTEPSPDTGGEPEVASGRGLVEEHNLAVEDFASEYPDSDVAELDGVKYIKDSNDTYTDDELRSIKDSVSEILHSIQPEFDFSGQLEFDFNGDQRNQAQAAGGEAGLSGGGYGSASADLRGLRQGVAKYFDWDKGWNGQEPSSFIDDQWDQLGYISFIGAKPNNGADLAKLFSVYKNPKLEYFHLILTKGNEIVYHLAMSAGVPDMSFAIPDGGSFRIKGLMKSVGADGYYLMHNHPGRANMQASGKDKSLTDWYASTIPGFKGHVILGNTSYGFFDEKQRYTVNELEGMHKIKGEFPLNKKDEDLGTFILNYTYNMKSPISIFYADSNNNFYDVENLYKLPTRKHINEKMKSEFYTRAWGVTTDWELYNEMMGLVSTAKPMYNLIDFYYIDPSVPDRTQNRSMKTSFRFRSVFHSDVWGPIQANITRRGERGSTKWEKEDASDTLYSLSPERKAEVLEQRKGEIKRAVEAGVFVSTDYLNEFRGEPWADEELELRDWMGDNPDVVSMAKSSATVDEFKRRYLGKETPATSKDEDDIPFGEGGLFDEEIPFTEPDEEKTTPEAETPSDVWFGKIFQYAHALSSADRDRQFAAEWTSSEDKTLELANALKKYTTARYNPKPGRRSGGYWYVSNVYGAFKGVSQKVRMLQDGSGKNPRSASEQIQEAQRLIRENPRPYRNAYNIAMQEESKAAQVRAGMQTGIGSDADWMRMELIDDDIAQEMERLEEESTEAKRAKSLGTDYKTKYDEIKRKLRDAERDLEKANVDKRTTVSSLRSQLDLANARIDSLNRQIKQDEADLKSAESEYSKLIERLGGKIEDLQEQNAELRGYRQKAMQLERQLQDRRERVADLRSQLTEANREQRRLSNALDALRRWKEAKEASDYRVRRIRQIKRLSEFNPASIDAIYEDTLLWIRGLFERSEEDIENRQNLTEQIARKKQEIERLSMQNEDTAQAKQDLLNLQRQKKLSRMVEPPALLSTYLPEGVTMLKAENRQSLWTAEELDMILAALKQMRFDGRTLLENRQNQRNDRLRGTSYAYFSEVMGRPAATNAEGFMSMRALEEDVRESLPEAEKSTGLKWFKLWNAKLQRLARILDGDREGVLYNWFVRTAYKRQSQEISGKNARYSRADAFLAELEKQGFRLSSLSKEGYTGEKGNGTKYSLTRGQMLGVYIYSLSDLGMEKLVDINGNYLTEKTVNDIISQLTPQELAWGRFMMDDMQENYGRLRDVYYRGWNMNLGQRDNYFTLVPSESVSDKDRDRTGMDPQGDLVGRDGKVYAERGFTKNVNPNAIYPLDLDATRTWFRQVAKQEHFIAYGEWAKDSQFLLDQGSMKELMARRFGQTEADNFQKIVNNIIGGEVSNNDFDRGWTKFLAKRNSAVLIGNTGVIVKQAPSWFAAFNGDITTKALSMATVGGNSALQDFLGDYPEIANLLPDGFDGKATSFIHSVAPEMKGRQIDLDIVEALNRMDSNAFQNAVRVTSDKIARYTIQAVDKMVVNNLWMGRYYTVFSEQKKKGKSDVDAHREAAFKASQMISETQPTSMRMDQSASQIDAKTSSFLRAVMVFTNQAINTFNQMFLDIPMAFRQKDAGKVAAKVASSMLMIASMALLSGKFIRRGDEDDDEYAFRVAREALSVAVQSMFPGFGAIAAHAIEYNSDFSTYIFGLDTFGKSVKTLLSPTKKKGFAEKLGDALIDIATEAGYAVGVPVSPFKNVVRTLESGDPAYLITSTWGQIIESYR